MSRLTKYQAEVVNLLKTRGVTISTVDSDKYYLLYDGEKMGKPIANRTVHALVDKGYLVVASPGAWRLRPRPGQQVPFADLLPGDKFTVVDGGMVCVKLGEHKEQAYHANGDPSHLVTINARVAETGGGLWIGNQDVYTA